MPTAPREFTSVATITMSFKFAKNPTADEMFDAIRGIQGIKGFPKPQCGVCAVCTSSKQRDCKNPLYYIFNYVITYTGMFQDPNSAPTIEDTIKRALVHETRGLIIGTDGRILRRPPQKFFNVGQHPHLGPDKIPWHLPHWITVKYDGSLIVPYKEYEGGLIIWGTRLGNTKMSQIINKFVSDHSDMDYSGFVEQCLENGATPFFEFCSSSHPIILQYDDDLMTLLGVRNMSDGTYWRRSHLEKLCDHFKIPISKIHCNPLRSADEYERFKRVNKDVEGIEGFVITFENGLMLKEKTEWYHKLSYAFNNFTKPNFVWGAILNQSVDDLAPDLPPTRQWLIAMSDAVSKGLLAKVRKVEEEVAEMKSIIDPDLSVLEKKRLFAGLVQNNHSSPSADGESSDRNLLENMRKIQKIYYVLYNKGVDAALKQLFHIAKKNINNPDFLHYLCGVRLENYTNT